MLRGDDNFAFWMIIGIGFAAGVIGTLAVQWIVNHVSVSMH